MFRVSNDRAIVPEGMRIDVDDHAQSFKMLLFVRHAWSIAESADIPELAPLPDVGDSVIPASPSMDVWTERWNREWQRNWDWTSLKEPQTEPLSQKQMQDLSRPGQQLHPAVPPFWIAEYGTEGFDQAAFATWDRQTMPSLPSQDSRESIAALAAAWEKGLTKIVVLPYKGYYASRSGADQIVISTQTKQDQQLFVRALGSWT